MTHIKGRLRPGNAHKNIARYGSEPADPRGDKSQRITPSDVARTREKSGPVKTWADMTAAERDEVRRSLGQKTRKP